MISSRTLFNVLPIALTLILTCTLGCESNSDSNEPENIKEDIVASETDCEGSDCASTPGTVQDFDFVSCRAVDICRACCDTVKCLNACEDLASATDKAAFIARDECKYDTCKPDCQNGAAKCYKCWDERCVEEFASCTWNPSGDLSCNEIFSCTDKCDTVPLQMASGGGYKVCTESEALTCHNNCLSSGDEEALALFDAYNDCTRTACVKECANYGKNDAATDKCNLCINERCVEQQQACVNDN